MGLIIKENIVISGEYTPTISNEINVTATISKAIYTRVNNKVDVSIYFGDIAIDSIELSGQLDIDLPINTNATYFIGFGQSDRFASTKDLKLFCEFSSLTFPRIAIIGSVIGSNSQCWIQFSYLIT